MNRERLKGLFIKTNKSMTLQDVVKVAKAEAARIGMGDKDKLRVGWYSRVPKYGGYSVVVETVELPE